MNSSKIGAQREKPPESKSSDGTEQSGSSESKPTDKTGSPKIGAQREKKQEEKNDGSTSAKPTKQEAKGNNWQIGRASGRERVCKYVSISVVAVSLKQKQNKYETVTKQETKN